MHVLLKQACDQADQALLRALRRSDFPRTRPSDRADLASAAPRALGVDAGTLAGGLTLDGTWLAAAQGQGGFVNFTLREAWFDALSALPPERLPWTDLPPVNVDCPARIDPFDWAFLTALKGRAPDSALAARQDRENPGALVRLTLRRLEQVEDRAAPQLPWTPERRALLLLLARCDVEAGSRRQALCLKQIAQAVWDLGPLELGAPLVRWSAAVLSQGCAVLQRA